VRDAIVIEEELVEKHPDDTFLRKQLEKFPGTNFVHPRLRRV